MGLLLLFAKDRSLFQRATAPAWVTSWLESRQKRAAKESNATAPVVDQKAQTKRTQARTAKIDEGLKELRLWLSDLIRHGFTSPQVKSYGYWDRMAARMVDAQASAVARRLRQIASIPMQGQAEWAARLLDEVSRLYLLADSYRRIDSLPTDLQEDLRTAIGWTHKKEELLALPALRDGWRVVGQWIEGDESLRMRRVWLFGKRTEQSALILDFAPGRAAFEESYMTGQIYDAELVYYPSAFPQRVLVKQIFSITTPDANHDNLSGYANATALLEQYANALAANPWLERIPFILNNVILAQCPDGWALYDIESRMLPIKLLGTAASCLWVFLAQSGGHPTTAMGEWDGYEVNLLEMI
jgi:hypothetical protein